MKEQLWDLEDIVLIPSVWTNINSRSECTLEYLPLMTAPMDTVIDENNYKHFNDQGITVCFPRGVYPKIEDTNNICFYSFSLKDIELEVSFLSKYLEEEYDSIIRDHKYILIDIANGHMKSLHNTIKKFKRIYPDKVLMVGNVANPYTFQLMVDLKVDFVRLGIGNGGACLTSANTGVNYPIGSLIKECKDIKENSKSDIKIVADGGMKTYADIIKSIGIGADYVMLGSMFNKSLESSGFNYFLGMKITNEKLLNFIWKHKLPIYKKYRGMSTKSVQRKWGNLNLKTAEGITKYQKVEYKLESWVKNFKDYLKSAMSYSNTSDLSEFIGNADFRFITQNSLKRYKK